MTAQRKNKVLKTTLHPAREKAKRTLLRTHLMREIWDLIKASAREGKWNPASSQRRRQDENAACVKLYSRQ
jgi:hypothetical protein